MKTIQSSTPGRNPAQKVQNTADLTNRKLYVGIDVHKMRWQVAVYYDGLILSNVSIEASAESFVNTCVSTMVRHCLVVCMRVDFLV